MLAPVPKSPIIPGNKRDRTGTAGILRRAGAAIRRRFELIERDVLAAFDRIPVYALNDERGPSVRYGITPSTLAAIAEELQATLARWIGSEARSTEFTFWWDGYQAEAAQLGDGAGGQPVAADLVAREPGLLQQAHRQAPVCQPLGGRRTPRTGADDDDVGDPAASGGTVYVGSDHGLVLAEGDQSFQEQFTRRGTRELIGPPDHQQRWPLDVGQGHAQQRVGQLGQVERHPGQPADIAGTLRECEHGCLTITDGVRARQAARAIGIGDGAGDQRLLGAGEGGPVWLPAGRVSPRCCCCVKRRSCRRGSAQRET